MQQKTVKTPSKVKTAVLAYIDRGRECFQRMFSIHPESKRMDDYDKTLREDLKMAVQVINGDYPGVDFEITKNSLDNSLSFIVGNTRIWPATFTPEAEPRAEVVGYQIADLTNGYYSSHRGFSSSLKESIEFVLNEKNSQQQH